VCPNFCFVSFLYPFFGLYQCFVVGWFDSLLFASFFDSLLLLYAYALFHTSNRAAVFTLCARLLLHFLLVSLCWVQRLVVCKDMYMPNKADFINRKLVRVFISWCINKTLPTMGHVDEALVFLQRKLSDAMNVLGEIPRKGSNREGPWIK
jgi:hypothetical protein